MKKQKKVLVMGSSGMIGHKVTNFLLSFSDFEVFDTSYRKKLRPKTVILDVCNQDLTKNLIFDLNPDYVVNCIGYLVGINPSYYRAIYLNSLFPHFLKDICAETNSKLIHISTDCVFSGQKGSYKELDKRDGTGLYSESKKLGEIDDEIHLTLRSSTIGPELKNEGIGLFQWFIRDDADIQGYTQTIWSGVSTLELAKAIKWAINYDITGIYHITNGLSINKNDLLNLFKKYTKSKIIIEPVSGKAQDKSFIDTRNIINYKIPSYEQMVMDMILDIKLNNDQYNYNYL